MTPWADKLKAWSEACQRATAGPWEGGSQMDGEVSCPDCLRPKATPEQWDNDHGYGDGCECAECVSVCWGCVSYCREVKERREAMASAADAEFIVLARSALPEAIAEIERLRELIRAHGHFDADEEES